MRIGYSYWGFLGDYKEDKDGNELSTPDGNAAYGGFLIDAMYKAGHEVAMLQLDRDWETFKRRGKYDFSSFSQDTRFTAYLKPLRCAQEFPKLDVLFLEWRMRIPGRNCEVDKSSPDYQPDLDRQMDLLRYYASGTNRPKIVIWDLDHKLTEQDEKMIASVAGSRTTVVETSVAPRKGLLPRVRVEPPVDTTALLQHTPKALNPKKKLVYVGSRYERDDVIEEWIKPVSDRFPGEVHFYGNWTREPSLSECKKMWPHVQYHGRISMKDFYEAYGDAVACPLLAKKSYLETGFITPRIWEALIFGTIPVGLGTHHGIEQYLPADLVAKNSQQLGDIVEWLSRCTPEQREELRRAVAARIDFMDAKYFVNTLERI